VRELSIRKWSQELATEAPTSKKIMYILRGACGSGKSTLSASLLAGTEGMSFSTDDFFMKSGNYEFEPLDISKAHKWNLKRTTEACQKAISPIVVDNTNTQRWEAKPYVEAGLRYRYVIEVKEPDTPWRRDAVELTKRNTHNVPFENIKRMLGRWENDFSIEAIISSEPPF